MSALLTTLPGDIPGLLRRGSPFTCDRLSERGEVREVLPTGAAIVADRGRIAVYMLPDLALDLTDITGRWHAALWARVADRLTAPFSRSERDALYLLIDFAVEGKGMAPEQIDTLARLVLRLAGRAP